MATAPSADVVIRCDNGTGCRIASFAAVVAVSLLGLQIGGQLSWGTPCAPDACAGKRWTLTDEPACHRWTENGIEAIDGVSAADCPNDCDAMHFAAATEAGGDRRRLLDPLNTTYPPESWTCNKLGYSIDEQSKDQDRSRSVCILPPLSPPPPNPLNTPPSPLPPPPAPVAPADTVTGYPTEALLDVFLS